MFLFPLIYLFHKNNTGVQCGTLSDPVNGRVSLSGTNFDSEATYTCISGFLLAGVEIRRCSADSTWSASAPVCVTEEGSLLLNHVHYRQ